MGKLGKPLLNSGSPAVNLFDGGFRVAPVPAILIVVLRASKILIGLTQEVNLVLGGVLAPPTQRRGDRLSAKSHGDIALLGGFALRGRVVILLRLNLIGDQCLQIVAVVSIEPGEAYPGIGRVGCEPGCQHELLPRQRIVFAQSGQMAVYKIKLRACALI